MENEEGTDWGGGHRRCSRKEMGIKRVTITFFLENKTINKEKKILA